MYSAKRAVEALERAGIVCRREPFFNGFHGERVVVARKDAARAERTVEAAALLYRGSERCFEFYS